MVRRSLWNENRESWDFDYNLGLDVNVATGSLGPGIGVGVACQRDGTTALPRPRGHLRPSVIALADCS